MTGYADSVVVGNGLLEQRMQVMTKPFALDALAAGVQGMISGQLLGGVPVGGSI